MDLSLSFDKATVNSFLNGRITAAGTISGSPSGSSSAATFAGNSSSSVDLSNKTLYIPAHGFTTGEQVTYTPQTQVAGAAPLAAKPIGGLSAGGSYYVLVVDPDHIQLSAKPPILLDSTGTNPASTQSLSTSTSLQFDIGGISNNAIFLQQNGFSSGDTVTYRVLSGSSPIANLTDGASYQVRALDGDNFQLLQNNQLISLAQNGATGTYTFTDGGLTQTLVLATVDSNANTITLAGNKFTEGQKIVYQSLTTASIGSLVDAKQYSVHVVSPGVFQFVDLTTKTAVALSSPAGASLHEIDYVVNVLKFKPATAVDPVTDAITLSNHGLVTGQAVIYHTDPTISSTTPVQVQSVLNFATGAISNNTITLPSHGFVDGDLLTYTAKAGSGPLAGLTSGAQYKIRVVDANSIQLLDLTTGQTVAVSQGNSPAHMPSSTAPTSRM